MAKTATTKVIDKSGSSGFVFFVAWIGALIYFVGQSDGFWGFILAFLKACVWPAYATYYGLQFLGV